MRDFVFYNPTKILFGKGMISRLGEEVKPYSSKVLLVYGKGSVKKNGVYDQVVSSLKENGIEFVELSGIKPNPVLSKVKEGIELARQEKIGGIIAMGGGSVIDTCKTIAAGFYYNGDIWDAFIKKYHVERSLPLFVVLTISATGSEMNGGAVITNEETKQKFSFWTNWSYPKISILDPSVQFTLPKNQTLNGAADAIAHVLEFYFDGTPNTMITDEISEGTIRTIMNSAEILLEDPKNYYARANLVWSATIALNGVNSVGRNGGDWSSHAIEHSLSALYDVAHGAGLAVVMPAWMMYVYKEDVRKFARFARKIFNVVEKDDEKAAVEGIEKLRTWYKKMGLPVTLKELGIDDRNIPQIVENASMRTPFGKLKSLDASDVQKILEMCE